MANANNLTPNYQDFLDVNNYGQRKKKKLIADIGPLIDSGFPVILNLVHFAEILKVEAITLGAIINSTDLFYRSFKIPKRSGALREIEAPYPI